MTHVSGACSHPCLCAHLWWPRDPVVLGSNPDPSRVQERHCGSPLAPQFCLWGPRLFLQQFVRQETQTGSPCPNPRFCSWAPHSRPIHRAPLFRREMGWGVFTHRWWDVGLSLAEGRVAWQGGRRLHPQRVVIACIQLEPNSGLNKMIHLSQEREKGNKGYGAPGRRCLFAPVGGTEGPGTGWAAAWQSCGQPQTQSFPSRTEVSPWGLSAP